MKPRLLFTGSVLVAVLSACGGGVSGMSDSATADLSSRVSDVRDAVLDGDRDGAEEALGDLNLAVVNLTEQGEITEAKAAAILDAANDVEAALTLLESTSETTVPTVPFEDDDLDLDGNEGPGKGNGKGKEKHGKG